MPCSVRRLAGDALEQHHLVGEFERIAVKQIDLELRGAGLVAQRIDRDAGDRTVFVDSPHHRIEEFQRLHVVGVLRPLPAAVRGDGAVTGSLGSGLGAVR